MTLSLKRRLSNKCRRYKKLVHTAPSSSIDDAPADRDALTTIETAISNTGDDAITFESKNSTHAINNDEMGVTGPVTHVPVNQTLLKRAVATQIDHHSHTTVQEESSDDDISCNSDTLSQGDYVSRLNNLSRDGDLSESDDDDYSHARNRFSSNLSLDDILLSECASSETQLSITYSSHLEDSDYPEERALNFSNDPLLDEDDECTSIELCNSIIPGEHQLNSDIEVRYDVGSIRADDSSRQYIGLSRESSESEMEKTLDSCLRKTADQSTQNECANFAIDSWETGYIYRAECDESELQQLLDVSLGKESLSEQNQSAGVSSDCNRRKSQATEITVREEQNVSAYDCIVGNLNETRIDGHSTCEGDDRKVDHRLDNRSQEFSIDFAPTRRLSTKEKIRMRVSIPPSLVRTFPVRRLITKKSKQAHALIRRHNTTFQKHVQRFSSEARQKKKATKKHEQAQKKKSRIIFIPSNHPFKILWDVFTVLLTFISAYTTHTSIRDRRYEFTTFAIFTEAWFVLDILLNFFTAHQHSDGTMICNGSAVWARYLTTWFPIDVLALVPWEGMFLTPIIERQNRRNIITKWFFRSKATVKVTRILRGRHFKIFGRVVNNTKKIGVGGRRLLTLIIKYLPKYILFYRNMKAVLVLKVLRQIHFGRKVARSMTKTSHENDEDEGRISDGDDDLQPDEHPDDAMGCAILENDDTSYMNNMPCDTEILRCSSDNINAERSSSES